MAIDEFRDWLVGQGKTRWTIREIIIYTKKYGYVLDVGDVPPLLALSARKKHHALTALANPSKVKEVYSDWLQMRQRHGLK